MPVKVIERDQKVVHLKNLKQEIRRSTILNNQKNKRMKANKKRKRLNSKKQIVKMKMMMIIMRKNLRNY